MTDVPMNLTKPERIEFLETQTLATIRGMIEEEFGRINVVYANSAGGFYRCSHCRREFDSAQFELHLAEWFLVAIKVKGE